MPAIRTRYKIRNIGYLNSVLARGVTASALTDSGGEIYVSTGLASPRFGMAMVAGSTNSASLKWGTHSLLHWVRGTGSYAVFRAYRMSQLNVAGVVVVPMAAVFVEVKLAVQVVASALASPA